MGTSRGEKVGEGWGRWMGAGTHLRGGANPVRVKLCDGGYERLGVLHGVHHLFFSRFIEGAHLRCSRRTRQCPDIKSEATAGLDSSSRISRAAAEVERDKLSIRRHTEARDYSVVRIDPTTVDVRRSLQSPRRRRRGAAHSPSPSRLPREGASRARDPMSHSLGDRASAMLFHFQTPTTVV